MQNALITVRSRAQNESEDETMEMLVGGRFAAADGGGFEIIYDETDPDTSEITHTTVAVEPGGRATVSRAGGISTHMIFENGKRHLVYYDTKYGSLLVGITTHRLDIALDERGGSLSVEYALELDGEIANEIALRIDVAPGGGEQENVEEIV